MSDLSTMQHIVQGTRVLGLLNGSHLPYPVVFDIAWAIPIAQGAGTTVSIPRAGDVTTNAGSKAEGADFALVSTSTANATMTAAFVGHADTVTDEVAYDAQEDAVAIVTDRGLRGLRQRMDSDAMVLGGTAATTTDFTDQAFTDQAFLDAQADFGANNPHEGDHAMVLGRFQVRDLKGDLSNGSGGPSLGGDAVSVAVQQLMGFKSTAYEGVRYGTPVFRGGNVPAVAGNHTGFICKIGEGGAIALGVWKSAYVEPDRKPRGAKWELTIANRYGMAISDPLNIHGITSRSAA
jgi:hypothetical protein